MAKLQKPPYVFMGGRITPWDDAKIHVGAEALTRGISVFEGIKGYWRHDGSEFALLALREHYDRLLRSAELQHLPCSITYEEFRDACSSLVRRLLTKERDLWLRATLFSIEGHWGEDTVTDLVITSYHQDKKRPEPIDIGISTWQRPSDSALPARIKSAANYQIGRLARIEGRRQGFSDMLLLNPAGRVAEATGSCLLMVRNERLVTPPWHEGCLESITVDMIEALCRSLSIPFERRPIDRTEVGIADAACLAGTLMELGRIRRIEARKLPEACPLLDRIEDEFWGCVRGQHGHPAFRLTPV
ncbi:MAG TPA: aminotransferase class IV [Methylomirabilota bacterium]|nr:aminotransferase class IV [Methylomirabilota bacterium]